MNAALTDEERKALKDALAPCACGGPFQSQVLVVEGIIAARLGRADAEITRLRDGIEALADHWSSCWCGPQMAPDHDPRRQDCPIDGDEAARYFAGGFAALLRNLMAELNIGDA